MILLQILDEGTITDSQGRKVDFKVYFFYMVYSVSLLLMQQHA
jgi:ATP-dependent Clp protease ATP-binding subunit ClpA